MLTARGLRCALAVFGLVVAGSTSRGDAVALYAFTDLGGFGGDTYANEVNNAGQVGGWSFDNLSKGQAFRWQAGSMTQLLPPSGLGCYGQAINSSGAVAGHWEQNSSPQVLHGVVWNGAIATPVGGSNFSTVLGINDAGAVTGRYVNTAAFWDPATSGPHLLGGGLSTATDINNNNWVVGGIDAAPAFVYDGTTMTSLPTFGGASGQANHINDANVVVGWAQDAANRKLGFQWQNGAISPLAPLPGHTQSLAFGVNASNLSVGQTTDGFVNFNWENSFATLWVNGAPIDLTSVTSGLGAYKLANVSSISDTGYIVGWTSRASDGKLHGFILTPLPEPGAAAASAILLTGAFSRSGRRRVKRYD
jgi:probable HAF family extracellular repeat protein